MIISNPDEMAALVVVIAVAATATTNFVPYNTGIGVAVAAGAECPDPNKINIACVGDRSARAWRRGRPRGSTAGTSTRTGTSAEPFCHLSSWRGHVRLRLGAAPTPRTGV